MTSDAVGFGYRKISTMSILVFGSIPTGGMTFNTSIWMDSDSFCLAFYKVKGSSIVAEDTIIPVGTGYSAVDNALGMTTYVRVKQNESTYQASVIVNNYSDSVQVVPTQTVTIIIYEFKSPFE